MSDPLPPRFGSPAVCLDDVEIAAEGDFRDEIDERFVIDALHEQLDTLSSREKAVLVGRFFDGLTLDKLGERHNVGRERIRQIEAKALRKMRHPSRMEPLWCAVNHVPIHLHQQAKLEEKLEEERQRNERQRLADERRRAAAKKGLATRRRNEEKKRKERERQEAENAKLTELLYQRQTEENQLRDEIQKRQEEAKRKAQNRRVENDYWLHQQRVTPLWHDMPEPPGICSLKHDKAGQPYIAVASNNYFSVDSETYDRWLDILVFRNSRVK